MFYVGVGICDQKKKTNFTVHKESTSYEQRQISSEYRLIRDFERDLALAESLLKEYEKNEKKAQQNYGNRSGYSNASGGNSGWYSSTGNQNRNSNSWRKNQGDNNQYRQNDSYSANDGLDLKACYALLGCSPNASDYEVKAAYRKLAMEYHPDRVSGAGLGPHIVHDAEEKLKQINKAYDIIKKARGMK